MDQTVPASLLKYSPDVERPEADEAETVRELVATMRSISEKTLSDGGHALRSVHAKSHGLLTGELTIPDDLPLPLRQGLFAKPGSYSVVFRLSTSPGDLLDDNVSTPRGLAMKIAGIEGERLPGSEGATTQDFVLVNGPAFSAPTPKKFLGNLKMLAATTDKAEGLKKLASAALRGLETVVEAAGGKSPTLTTLGGQRETHILGETFFSQAPIRYDDYIAKIAVVPVSPELTKLTDQPLDLNHEPDGLRAAVVEFFRQHDATWEVRVQLCTDLEAMPVEDASVVWPEDQSPYIAVARLTARRQTTWDEDRIRSINENLSFSPWHGLLAHRPLGGVMRARKPAYEMSARFRADHGAAIKEPKSKAEMPV